MEGTGAVVGLGNRGDDCYVNTAFQMLLCVGELQALKDSCRSGLLFLDALKQAKNAKSGDILVTPHTAIWACIEQFTGGSPNDSLQCDLYDFLDYFLQGLSTDLGTNPGLSQLLGLSIARVHHTILCLELAPTLETALSRLNSPIERLSPYILIAFKRLKWTKGRPHKRTEPILFPERLDFAPFQAYPSPQSSYSLIAVAVHHGDTCESGHYSLFFKSAAAVSTWFHANDAVVRGVSWGWVKRQQAYFLLYKLSTNLND